MGANVSSPDQRFPVADLRSRKPWTPRFEPEISPFKVNSPFVMEIKNTNQWKSRLNALKDTNKLVTYILINPKKVFLLKVGDGSTLVYKGYGSLYSLPIGFDLETHNPTWY